MSMFESKGNGMRYFGVFVTVAFLILALSGCPRKRGPMEKAGERIDEIADNAQDGDPLFHKKGPGERAGEAIDDAMNE